MSIDPKAFGLSNSLVSAVNEALKGGQKKLDKNHNGKLDAQDFKMLRREDKDKQQAVANEQTPGDYAKINYKHPMMKEVADANKANFKANMKEGSEEKDATNPKQGSSVNPKQREIDEDDKHFAQQSKKMQDAINLHLRRGKSYGDAVKAAKVHVKEEVEVSEAAAVGAPGVADQMAAKKDALQAQIQRKIASKQMQTMQAKANKRISNMKEDDSKKACGCTEDKKCADHSEKGEKETKGGKEVIVMNPPLKESGELPKKVVSKGHEIAKSLIKHRAKVKNAYAVGMATAKKSAGIKEDVEQIDELSKETMKSYVKAVDKRKEGVKRGTGLNTASQKIAKQEPTSTLKKTVDAIKNTPHGKLKSSSVYKFGASHAELQKRGVKEENEQVDEVLDTPFKKMGYIMKAKKSIEKSDPKKIKQANDVANRVIGIKRVMNKMNKKD